MCWLQLNLALDSPFLLKSGHLASTLACTLELRCYFAPFVRASLGILRTFCPKRVAHTVRETTGSPSATCKLLSVFHRSWRRLDSIHRFCLRLGALIVFSFEMLVSRVYLDPSKGHPTSSFHVGRRSIVSLTTPSPHQTCNTLKPVPTIEGRVLCTRGVPLSVSWCTITDLLDGNRSHAVVKPSII